MAQYEIDFEALALDTYPSALTRRWVTSQPQPLVKAAIATTLGFTKELRAQRGAAVRELNSINAIDADADRATVKGRVLVHTGTGSGTSATPIWLGVVRASGSAGAENGYHFSLTRDSGYRLNIGSYKSGTSATGLSASTTAWEQDTYYVAEWEVSGTSTTTLTLSLYALTDLDTPVSTHTRVDSSSPVTAAGWVGIGGFGSTAQPSHLYVAVATGASDLPAAPWDVPTSDPVSFSGTVSAQSWVEDSAITPLDLSSYFAGDLTPFSYAVTTGTLPAGLSLNSSTGVISGTPTTPASAVSIVVTAIDDESNTAATNAFNVTITSFVEAIRGVQVILHDRATQSPRASVTGITARWWDSPTAAGAPLLKTDSASTDAAGLLELDIESVTSLSLAGVGYLSIYKAGATPETDLHFASRLSVVDIA